MTNLIENTNSIVYVKNSNSGGYGTDYLQILNKKQRRTRWDDNIKPCKNFI